MEQKKDLQDLITNPTQEYLYINIEKEQIPYFFNFDYDDKIYEIEIRYNVEYDFFTTDLYIINEGQREILILGDKIVYGEFLYNSLIKKGMDVPLIFPYDLSGKSNRVGYDELGEYIKLVVLK